MRRLSPQASVLLAWLRHALIAAVASRVKIQRRQAPDVRVLDTKAAWNFNHLGYLCPLHEAVTYSTSTPDGRMCVRILPDLGTGRGQDASLHPLKAASGGGVRRRGDHFGCRGAAAGGGGSRDQADRAVCRVLSRRAARGADRAEVVTLVGQRVFGIALGYEDLNDHDELRHDPMMAVLAGKLEARREDCAPVAGKSTLNRLELSRLEPTRYHKISHDPVAIKRLFVDLFLEAHERAAERDHPRSRCDRRSGARRSGRAVLPRLLRLLLLSAALHVLRPPSVGRQAAAGEHRCARRARSRRWRASSRRSAGAGRRCASCCAPTRALPATS